MFPNAYFPSGSGSLFVENGLLKYKHFDGNVLMVTAVPDPASVPGLQLWLKADAITGLSDGVAVSSWSDFSGQGRSATQSLAARRPIYRTGLRNGLPAVRFDGVDDCLDGASANWRTFIAVVFAGTSPTAHMSLWGQSTAGADMSIRRFAFGPGYSHNNANDFAPSTAYRINGVATNQAANGAWHIVVCESPIVRAFPYRVGGTGLYTPGRTFAGDVAEVLVFDRLLNPNERGDMERYLSLKYALQIGA